MADVPYIFDLLRSSPPNSKPQADFFRAVAPHIAYGGARGGGKSWAMRRKFVLLCMHYPRLRVLLMRRTFPELRENHILPLMMDLNGYAKYNDSEKAFTFPNGSRLKLGYCAVETDVYQYQGQEYDVIGLEEATNFTESQRDFIVTCNRNTRPDFAPRMYYTANPGGVGHDWFKRLFISRDYKADEKPEDYVFISAKVTDNPAIMENNPQYIRNLKNLPEAMRRAHLDGDWDVFAGQVFSEWSNKPDHYNDRRWTHVIAPFQVPDHWPIFRGFDFGFSKPYSVGWYAVDNDNRLYRIRELYGCTGDQNTGVRQSPDQIAREIKRIEAEDDNLKGKDIVGIADPSIYDESRGESIAVMMEREGVYFDRADNHRIAGKMQIHYRLSFDDRGIPMLYVFTNNRGLIRTLPRLTYDDHHVEDVDTSQEDHIYDELRYVCMERPIGAPNKEPEKPKEYNPMEDDPGTDSTLQSYNYIRIF